MLSSIIKNSLRIVLAFTFILSSTVHALDSCSLKPTNSNTSVPLLKDTPSELRLHKGDNHLELTCSLKGGGVLSFTRPALTHFSWLQDGITKPPLQSNQMAVLMEQGDFTALLNITATAHYTPRFTWSDTQTFIAKIQQYNLIFGLFYGLCATLILYVLIIGYGIKDAIFKLYGLYLLSLTSFIFLQEGQPYLFLQGYFYESVNRLYTLSIGMTVVTATWFMSALLALPSYWPKVNCTLKIAAACVLILCLQRITLDMPMLIPITSAISGYVTLLIVLAIFILSAIQAKKGVNEANLVFIALSCVFVSMLFRVLLPESSPFIQRYGFVIAFTIESILLAIAVGRRIQRLNYAKKEAERQANFDPLCHIYNRRGWSLQADNLLSKHAQRGGLLCFLYIDLDHFKAINDTYGHDVGDKVLQKVAHTITRLMRKGDAVGRLGGDEFVAMALFSSNESIHQRVATLEAQLNNLSIKHQSHRIAISASVGQVNYTNKAHGLDEILKAGDKAMYLKKTQRKVNAQPIAQAQSV